MKNKSVLMVLIIAVVLTLAPVSSVRATDTVLEPVSGSSFDSTTFEFKGHTVAKGFAAAISADLPFDRETQIKFGSAVAGLGEPWIETDIYTYRHEYNPYVKEMRVTVEGDYYYSAWEDSIVDNTGTGGHSAEFFGAVLTGIDLIFNAYEIYQWLAEVYQLPPVAEWKPSAHGSKAISRQGGWVNLPPTWLPYLGTTETHIQTASANVLGYFSEGSSNILNVTAEAEIYVQWYDLINGWIIQNYIGTYSVSFLVSAPGGMTTTLSISAGSGGTTDPVPGSYSYACGSTVTVTASANSGQGYTFDYWVLDGATVSGNPNPITVTMNSCHTLKAYFKYTGGGGGGGGGRPLTIP